MTQLTRSGPTGIGLCSPVGTPAWCSTVRCTCRTTTGACSLAGHLGLGKLTAFYDDNEVTLDRPVSWSSSEDITTWFLAQGWHVVRRGDVDDFGAIDAAVTAAQQRTH